MNELLLAFLRHAQADYRRADGTNTEELANYKQVLQLVREAIAGETGRAVAEAVRAAVAHALTSDPPGDESRRHRPPPDPWDDPPADRWAEAGEWAYADADTPPPPLPGPALNSTDRTRLAVAAGLAAGRWVLSRGPLPAALAVGGLVALAVLFGGPATHAAALAAPADLSAVSRALRPHPTER